MPKYVIICDIDNCYTDSREWIKHVPESHDRKAWDEYQALHYLCKPNPSVINLLCATEEVLPIYFVTSREDRGDVKQYTIDQIEKFSNGKIKLTGKTHHRLYMRKEFDYRHSDVVKEEILKEIVSEKHIPILAIDDELTNCEMFKKYKIPTNKYDINTDTMTKYYVLESPDMAENSNN